jgi:hypothetical protein
MPLLSKSEIQFLQGQKQVSKSYEYKIKSIIKKKTSTLMYKELPLLVKLFPDYNLTITSKKIDNEKHNNLTEFSKNSNEKPLTKPTKISKKFLDSHSNIDFEKKDVLPKQQKLVAREGLEGSNLVNDDNIQQKTLETSDSTLNKMTNKRRERDSNPRGPHGPQALCLFVYSRLAPYQARRPRLNNSNRLFVFFVLI